MTAAAKVPSQPTLAPPVKRRRRRRTVIIAAIAGAGVIILAAGIWLIAAALREDAPPRLNENAVVLTRFVESKNFEKLPFEQQRQFYKVLDDRDGAGELDQAFSSGKLSESEYRAGLEAAWLGKHINRVEKYFSLAPGIARTNYLIKLVDKKERKTAKPTAGSAGKGAGGAAAGAGAEKIDVNETAAEMKVEKWPASVRTQWDTFHEAYRNQRKAIEKANATTNPAGAAAAKPKKKT